MRRQISALRPRRRTSAICLAMAFAFGGAAAPVLAKDPPVVAVSVKPLYGIVATVMTGAGKPLLLFPKRPPRGKTTLTAVQLDALDRAQVLFWIGPQLETPLVKPLIERKGRLAEVSLIVAPGVRHQEYLTPKQLAAIAEKEAGRNPAKAKTAPDKDPKDAGDKPDKGEDEADKPKRKWLPRNRALTRKDLAVKVPDPHIWLDPRNAIALTRHIAAVLSDIDPQRRLIYRRNAAAMIVRIETMDAQFDEAIRPVKRRAFASLNNHLQHFEGQYDMSPATRLDLVPGKLDRKTILAARVRVRDERVRCLFATPDFDSRSAAAVAAGTYARLVVVDPFGREETLGRGVYMATMRTMAAQISDCLQNPKGQRR